LGTGCHREDAASAAPGETRQIVVTLSPVRAGSADRTIDVSGTLFGQEEAVVSAKSAGRILTVEADVGDAVDPGAVLARIEPRDAELALAERRAMLRESLARLGLTEMPGEGFDPSEVPTVVRARAEESNAEARARRARQLFDQTPPLISEQDYADIQTRWEVSRSDAEVALLTARAVLAEAGTQAAAVALAEQALADTTVRAPGAAGGVDLSYAVAERRVSVGEYVTEGTPMFRVVASELIKFRALVPERFAGSIAPGQAAEVWVEAYAEPFAGKVERVAPSIDGASRMFQIEIHIPNADHRLKAGAFARGRVAFRREEGIEFVPADSVVTFAGVQKVFSVADGKAVEHRVRLGVRDGDWVEIVGGIDASEVVVTGAPVLSRNAPVRVAPSAAPGE
jgi:RND family efflux transporter MFP subunit